MKKIKGNLNDGFLVVVLLVLSLIILSPIVSSADPLDYWHWRNPLPKGNGLYAITY